jgi:2-haloacid dehalogenase
MGETRTGDLSGIRACLFDVFGTVVDWRGSVERELSTFAAAKGITGVDWLRFAKDWRRLYDPAMQEVRSGRRDFVILDVLHRENLVTLLERYEIGGLTDADVDEMNLVWHHLDPWPDSVEGLTRLKSRYVIAPCSNGNIALIVDMAKRARLPWDVVLGSEPTRSYKRSPQTYLASCRMLGIDASEALMVAAHNVDLDAARECGLRTAFVPRPTEWDKEAGEGVDVVADDFVALAAALGC